MKITGRSNDEQTLIENIIKSGNGHILSFWNELNNNEKDCLIKDIKMADFNKIKELFASYRDNKPEIKKIQPTVYLNAADADDQKLKETGENALRSGEVAFLTVAGGQGSRLDYDHPKGCYPISPVKNKSLFQIFAEKIKFYSEYYKHDFYWFIMTSAGNNNETIAFFKDNNYFNLNQQRIVFFIQGQLPTLTLDGKLILQNKNRLFLNPDGHGGIIKSLSDNNLLNKMKDNNIKHLSYFQVDNPMVKIADPYFIGYHIAQKSEVSSKVIPKKFAEEKLGIICRYNGKNTIIEYSDLTEKDMYNRDKNGNLTYLAGSIAIHIFDVDFLIHSSAKLPYHFAVKTVKGYKFDPDKTPEFNEFKGLKFEHFVFDVIPMTEISVFFETVREEEFFPLKNKTGDDSIDTCIKGQISLHLSWLNGIKELKNGYKDQIIEISPLYAPDKDFFLNKIKKDFDKINSVIFDKNGRINEKIYIG